MTKYEPMSSNNKTNLYGLTRDELEQWLVGHNENPAKAAMIYRGLYRDRITDLLQLDRLRRPLLHRMSEEFSLTLPAVVRKQENEQVCKYLLELSDGNCIETVLMKHSFGAALCLSTQVGCRMGCRFCASGQLKKLRDLSAAEIVTQLLAVETERGQTIDHMVIMGIGEPFDNYDDLESFLDIVTDDQGLHIGPRHITVSTCGLLNGIQRFGQRPRPNNLAVSLHAPTDELRRCLMPIAKSTPLSELMQTLHEYRRRTGQRITVEYLLLRDVNDSITQADQLADLLRGLDCTVNLIPYNETEGSGFQRSSAEQTAAFYDRLKKQGQYVTLRKELGADVQAACGQLRARELHE